MAPGSPSLIATDRYRSLYRLKNARISRPFLAWLLKRLAGSVEQGGPELPALCTEDVCALLPTRPGITDYGSLYNRFLPQIDPDELFTMINRFLGAVETIAPGNPEIRWAKSNLFEVFVTYWCPLVEYGRRIAPGELLFLGSPMSPELAVLRDSRAGSPGWVRVRNGLATRLLRLMENTMTRLKSGRKSRNDALLRGYGPGPALGPPGAKKTIVVGILEERRYSRVAELTRELTALGYHVRLSALLPKTETIDALSRFPDLAPLLLRSSAVLSRAEEERIASEAIHRMKALCCRIEREGNLDSFTYKGVPLFRHAWRELVSVIEFRGAQAALISAAVNRVLDRGDIAGFVSLDSNITTAVWMDECRRRSIPTFLHFYNALSSPAFLRALKEAFQPSAWLLGGQRQVGFLRAAGISNDQKMIVTGDLFADATFRCDRAAIRRSVRDKLGIREEEAVLLLLSSYVAGGFTTERKRALFTNTAEAARALGARLVVKAHPNERRDVLVGQLAAWQIEAPILQFENIRDVLFACDVMCMYFSETAQQAMLAGVPVLALVPPDSKNDFDAHWDYFSTNAVVFNPLDAQATEAVRALLPGGQNREIQIAQGFAYAENVLGHRDGGNARRFAEAVHSILENRK